MKHRECLFVTQPVIGPGMILYNGQKRTTGADFISLGLVGGRPEFRWVFFSLSLFLSISFLCYLSSSTYCSHTHPQKHSLLRRLYVRRFDVGSGMATIRYPTPIRLGEFHTVELVRNNTLGTLIVDGEPAINGSSQVTLTQC